MNYQTALKRSKRISFLLLLISVVAFALNFVFTSSAEKFTGNSNYTSSGDKSGTASVEQAYGKLPLSFERNDGQTDGAVKFVAQGHGYQLFLTNDEAVLALRQKPKNDQERPSFKVVRMRLVGANQNIKTSGEEQLPGKMNYFIGNERDKWRTDVPLFARVRYENVYNGISLVYYGNQRQLEYDFEVSPGTDPRAIKLQFEGANKLTIDKKDGSLVLAIEDSEVRFAKPLVYQFSKDGNRKEITSSYRVRGNKVEFVVGEFDKTASLIIDPILSYSTFIRAATGETPRGITVDTGGNAYITGNAGTMLFPGGSTFIPPSTSDHAFVTKVNPTGTAIVYSALIGGSSSDAGAGIAIDSTGAAYITGKTNSLDFPTVNAIRDNNANLIKSLNSGSSWALSNTGLEQLAVRKIVPHPVTANTVYAIAGQSSFYRSTDNGSSWTILNASGPPVNTFVIDPLTPSTIYATSTDGVIKSTDGGTNWVPANTGMNTTSVFALAIDPQNPQTLYASTTFTVFKTTNGGSSWSSASTGINFGTNGFLIDPTNSNIVYALSQGGGIFKTVNGGTNWTRMITGMTSTSVVAAVIDPLTPSTLYVVTPGGGVFKSVNSADTWNQVNNGLTNVITRSIAINPASPSTIYVGTDGTAIFKTVDGGSNWVKVYSGLSTPGVFALAVNPVSPATVYAGIHPQGATSNSDSEVFVTKLNAAGNALVYSTYLGGSGNDEAGGIGVDGSGNAIVTGWTFSTDFQLANPRQSVLQGTQDAFVTKLAANGSSLVYSTLHGGSSNDFGRAIAVDGSGNAYITGSTTSANFPITPGAFQTLGPPQSFSPSDAFVSKFDPTGQTLSYSTFLGAADTEVGNGIAVDTSGNAYVTGVTNSGAFPTANAFQPMMGGGAFAGDAFITKLNSSGTGLVYSTYLGGLSDDFGRGIAVDGSGSAYVVGLTRSPDFPIVAGALKLVNPFFVSGNAGGNWTRQGIGLPPASDLAIHPTSGALYAATVRGFYRSSNGGYSWAPSNTGLPLRQFRTVTVDPQNPNIIYLTETNQTPGVFKSTDGGSTWSAANGNQNFFDTIALAVDPSTSNTVYLATSFQVFKTTNGGTIWNQVGTGQLSSISSIVVHPQDSQTIYVSRNSSGGGISRSTDGGATWVSIAAGLESTFVGEVTVHPTTPSTLFASTNLGLSRSTDSGATWTHVFDTGGRVSYDPNNASTIYLASFNSATGDVIFKSTNGGTTWVPLASAQITSAVRVVVRPQDSSQLYVIGNSGQIDDDAFVTKLNPAGNTLAYSTYLAGPLVTNMSSTSEVANGVAVDTAGNAYVTGTGGLGFPVTPGAMATTSNLSAGFVSKLTQGFSISGTVSNGASVPQSGVKVTLSGAANGTFVTGPDGTFQFLNLVPGSTYTVSCTKTGFSFTPPSQTFSNINADQVANFTLAPSATPFHTISGQIVILESLEPLVGANVALTGSQVEFTTTDSNGNYSFSAPAGGNYTVTPTLLGFNITPPGNSVTNLSGNTSLNFQALRLNFVVTNTNDEGTGSLRQAMLDANATQGVDRIIFNIPGSGVRTISLTAALPTITDPVTIDGSTQPGFAGSPLVEINGTSAGSGVHGLFITSGNSTIRGLVINRFNGSGIQIQTNGNNQIQGNIIGLDPTGTVKRQNNGSGIELSGTSANLIGGTTVAARNVISGNGHSGIGMGGSNNQIKGNFIGTNLAGTAALSNIDYGIDISNNVGTGLSNNLIGGTEAGAGNLISGNDRNGIELRSPGTIVQGNYIGTDISGTLKIPNSIGLNLDGNNCLIGGTTAGARNVISGNQVGIDISVFVNPPISATVQGNYIGTDPTGTIAVGNNIGISAAGQATIGGLQAGAGNLISGNTGPGIQLSSFNTGFTTIQGNLIGTNAAGDQALGNQTGINIQTSSNLIGGPQANAGNVIAGNVIGIAMGGQTTATPQSNTIQGNKIGISRDLTIPIGNSNAGIRLDEATMTLIGGDLPAEANVIRFNQIGVQVGTSTSSINNTIKGNNISSNALLGIDLNFDRVVTPNDPGDVDNGSNTLQNFPVIGQVTVGANQTQVAGSLSSTPSTQFRIDYYSVVACSASGNGEGAVALGSSQVTTDSNGVANIATTLQVALGANRTVTATATNPAGNTSEFSPCNAASTIGVFEFSGPDFHALEDVGNAVIKIRRVGGTSGPGIKVNYSTSGGTATPGSDYTATSGSVTFQQGETEKEITIPINNDAVTEPEETVGIKLSVDNPADIELLGAQFQTTLHILDSSTTLTISMDQRSFIDGYPEGNVGRRDTNIPVFLNAQTSRTVTVNYAVSGGSATADVDYVPVSGTLTFSPGTEIKNVVVPIIGDTLDENNETFNLVLSNPVNASLGFPAGGAIPIIDDDASPQLSVTDAGVKEEAGAKAVFVVSLSTVSARVVVVSFDTTNGTATAGSDYTSTSGALFFNPGETSKVIEVPILTDGTVEADETFILNLRFPASATLADNQGVGTILDASSPSSLINFSATSYSALESDNQVQIVVNRSGSTAAAATVNYRTVAQTASDRTDFTTAVGTLRFDPGVATQSFNVLLTNDTFFENTETLALVLSSPTGALLGGPGNVPLSIISNDITDTPSPVRDDTFSSSFFVRQHYHDFLNREPDAAGLAFWVDQIDSCGADAQCKEVRKINVSAAFFLSIEFQETGYLVYRAYRAGYGMTTSPNVAIPVPVIRLNEFLPDSQRIGRDVQVGVGNWEQQLEANKVAYFLEFVQTQRFLSAFPLSMTPAQFVDKLNQNSGDVLTQAERDQLVSELTNASDQTQGRAGVVRKVADDATMRDNERNRAFVLMQYYGYMRRNPDDPQDTDFRGWEFWLNKLDQFNGNFVNAEMVKAFITSIEYTERFGR